MKMTQILPTMRQISCVLRLGRLLYWPIRDWSGESSDYWRCGCCAKQFWSLSRLAPNARFGNLGRCFPPPDQQKISRTMSRWIRHPALVWTLLCLFGVPNLLGQGFHIAIHHSHASHCHDSDGDGSPSAEPATGCAHAHSHAKSESTAAKKHSCGHHRHSHAADAQTQPETKLPAISVATPGHDHHGCSICQYFSTAQVLVQPVECVVSQLLTSQFQVSLPAAVFCERYSASSPRGPPVA